MKQDLKFEAIRHSLSHLMSMAIMEKYPQAGLGVGPAIDNGFYQDYDLPDAISDQDFVWIEKRMRDLIAQNIKFVKEESDFASALEFYKHDPYKTEMIDDLKAKGEKTLSFYDSDWFHNLCAGPHVESTAEIDPESFKLDKLAGAYWRGDEKNKMLQRIYGLAFESKEKLDEFLHNREEAEKRDHKKLGEKLDLFTFSELVGPGLPLYTFKGTAILNELKAYINELQSGIGYQEVLTPSMNRAELFKVSGHYEKYKDDLFSVHSHYSKEEYFLKPMNCPQHTQIYASKPRSYKDLPIRIADFSQLHRDEKTGELSGLTRLRGFRQDDGHAFCREDQIKDEFKSVLSIVKVALDTFGMNYKVRLSLWDPEQPEKYLGDAQVWERSQKMLEDILVENKIEHFKASGEAAIYGPKMDLISTDSLGREWQLSTIQLDFIMPERFDLKYIDLDGKEKTPVMVHRAIMGSPERFLGILIEHYAGAFPVWLSPVQVKILTISEKQKEYASEVLLKLKAEMIRAELDQSDESLGKKIRNAELEKVPIVWVIGDKEVESEQIAQRPRKDYADQITDGSFDIEKAIEQIKKMISEKS